MEDLNKTQRLNRSSDGHPADAQGGHFAEAEPGVGQQTDDVAVLPRRIGELLDLVASEKPGFGPACPRQGWG